MHALDIMRTKLRSKMTKDKYIDKAMETFEKLDITEPNSPRFYDIAGKALGYVGANNDSRPNQTLNITMNNMEAGKLPLAEKWNALRKMLEAE